MPVTINDVAREAGVSITTVSRVLNNNYPVKSETRERIEKAIEKLSYKPNIMARSLITKKSGIIGVVVPGITNIFFPTIVETIDGYIKSMGYSMHLCNTGGNSQEEKKLVEELLARQIDGMIIIDPTKDNLNNGYFKDIAQKIPMVIINGDCNEVEYCSVAYDESIGAAKAFEYLFLLGHRKIAFIRGRNSLSYDIREKVYRDFLQRKNIEYNKVIEVGSGNSIEVVDEVEEKSLEVFEVASKPTAIFACNDLMALGVLNACKKLSLKVPEEVSVIGFDNTLFSSITVPRLTTVDLNIKKAGNLAAEELLKLIENEGTEKSRIILETSLVIRESCHNAIK